MNVCNYEYHQVCSTSQTGTDNFLLYLEPALQCSHHDLRLLLRQHPEQEHGHTHTLMQQQEDSRPLPTEQRPLTFLYQRFGCEGELYPALTNLINSKVG